jgi:type II secretory pathway component PulF
MNTSYELNAYRSHELSIQMKTSSGDVINLDFENTQELALSGQKNPKGESASFSFSSLQQYQFRMQSNGIDAQDKKEIAAFMEIAKPYIENFMQEVADQEQKTPLNQIADLVDKAMQPMKALEAESKQNAKHDLVKLFDDTLKTFEQSQKLIDESQKLLDKILKGFDKDFESMLYA